MGDRFAELIGEALHKRVSRRDALKVVAYAGGKALGAPDFPKPVAALSQEIAKAADGEMREIKIDADPRVEAFRPLGGNAEWQYVAAEIETLDKQKVGIVVSMGVTRPPGGGQETDQMVVMKHDETTGKTEQQTYKGVRTFDEATFTYTFRDTQGRSSTLAYDSEAKAYSLTVDTQEVNTQTLAGGALKLKPVGSLIRESGGPFTVAEIEGENHWKLITPVYTADFTDVVNTYEQVIGSARRDSQNMTLEGNTLGDVDHEWRAIMAKLKDGRRVCMSCWRGNPGENSFVTILKETAPSSGEYELIQHNNHDGLTVETTITATQPTDRQDKATLPIGGRTVVKLGEQVLVDIWMEAPPGQLLTDPSRGVSMTEAVARHLKGAVLGEEVVESPDIALFESSTEVWRTFAPVVVKA